MKAYTKAIDTSSYSALHTLGVSFAGSLLIALSAQVALPFFSVPFTLHTAAVMWLALNLGKERAVMAVLLYLAEVSMGLPVLNQGFSNPMALVGPTGGYLLGLIPLALFFSTSLKSALAVCLQLGLGAIVLSAYIGAESAFLLGFLPFLAVEAFKMIAVYKLHLKPDLRPYIAL